MVEQAPAAGAVEDKPAEGETILDEAKPAATSDKQSGEPPAKPDANADGSTKPPAEAPKPGDEKKPPVEDKKPEPSKPLGAPEKYEAFKAPEGVTLDPKAMEAFQGVAKELGLSQDQAQKLVDFQTQAIKVATDDQQAQFAKMQSDWAAETRKSLGADADKQLAYVAQFRDKFLTPGAREILNQSGMANHPEIIKSFIQAGKAISEDGFIGGRPAGDKGDKTPAQAVYPDLPTEG